MEHVLVEAVTHNYSYSSSGGGAAASMLFLDVALYVVTAVGMFRTFRKAGQAGWAGFVPIYNVYVLLKMAGRPTWWLWFVLSPLVLVVPVLGVLLYVAAAIAMLVGWILVLNDTSKSFGHGAGFTVGLFFLPVVFFCILGFDKNPYLGPAGPEGRARRVGPPTTPAAATSASGWRPPPSAQVPSPPPPPPAPAG